MKVCAELGMPELSQFHAGLALEPQWTVLVLICQGYRKGGDGFAAPGLPNAAQTSTYDVKPYSGPISLVFVFLKETVDLPNMCFYLR